MQYLAPSLEALLRCSAMTPCAVVAQEDLVEHSAISRHSGEKRRDVRTRQAAVQGERMAVRSPVSAHGIL